jgi:hypothetical protein
MRLNQCGAGAVGEDTYESRVAIEGGGHKDLYILVFIGYIFYKYGKISLQVRAWGEEVGDDNDSLDAPGNEEIGCLLKTGTPEFEEGGLYERVVAGTCEFGCSRADCLIGRFDSGAVGEDDDSRSHALLM